MNKKTKYLTGLSTAVLLASPFSLLAENATQPSRDQQQVRESSSANQQNRSQDQSQSSRQVQARGQNADTQTRSVDARRAESAPAHAINPIGMDVENRNGDDVGSVDEVFIDMKSGEVTAVVVSSGGFLGMGAHRSLVASQDLQYRTESDVLLTSVTKDQLRQMPRFRHGDVAGLDNVRPLRTDVNRERDNRSAADTRADERRSSAANRSDERRDSGSDARRDASGRIHYAVSDLTGMSVENAEGDKIGDVEKVYIDLENGRVVGVVLSTGGFLGMGSSSHVLALNEIQYDAANDKLRVNMDRDRLKSAPTYDEDDHAWVLLVHNRSSEYGESGRTTSRDNVRTDARREQRANHQTTVFDQGNSSEEIEKTARIRRAIRDNDTLSARARNVTIITQGNKVLVRGEVDSSAEKSKIEEIARNEAGRTNLTSELTVRQR
ncbi:MAG: BON domain-containing protein [Puniceicoccaceae bacterium]|nr:MAG: BON domain-containing protein [Puniceicoccaceae bacterium]